MKTWIKEHALALFFFTAFLVTWLGQFFIQVHLVAAEAAQHGEAFHWSDFWLQFGKDTLENWQSEFLQVGSFVVVTAYLIYRGSSESKDGDERMEKKIDEILETVRKKKAT